ncbi:MAG: methanethiol S-methyltransferase [Planctomycetota bacterium]|jgi:protein-S-isoprenylcysteine O-methyltransferase Ste14
MNRVAVFVYGVVAYVIFFVTFCYAIGFVGSLVVPKGIDDGAEGSLGAAIGINVVLLLLFGGQHSIMARPAFKDWWTKIVPVAIERSTFVLLASLILVLMFWQWRPVTASIWQIDAPWARNILIGISLFGWLLVLYSTFLIDHFDLFGLRQVYLYLRGRPYTPPAFVERSIYRLVRHPLMLGFLIAFWVTPDMTAGHLLFAVVTTVYVLAAIQVEERDLARSLGDDYREYRTRTRMLVPLPKRSG